MKHGEVIYKKYNGDTWIETSKITWYNDNAQKKRDRILKKILS